MHLIWRCGTFPGWLAWGWHLPFLAAAGRAAQGDGVSFQSLLCPWLLVPGSSAQHFSPMGPHSAINSPTVPNFVNKRPYIFQLSVSFPNPMVTIPSSPQKILLPSRLLRGCSRVCMLRVNSNTPVVWQNHSEVYRSQHIQVTGGWSEGVVFVPQEWANASHWF